MLSLLLLLLFWRLGGLLFVDFGLGFFGVMGFVWFIFGWLVVLVIFFVVDWLGWILCLFGVFSYSVYFFVLLLDQKLYCFENFH